MVKAVADGANSKAMHRIAMVDTKLRAMVFDFKVGIVPTFFVLTFSPLSPMTMITDEEARRRARRRECCAKSLV